MTRLVKPLRLFFAYIAPILLALAGAAKYYLPEAIWPQIAFAILLASCVGFFTNFIAIKMLFRPRNITAFGRQGLIPRQQPELAQRLGEGINEHFFNAPELRDYIDNNQLLPKASNSLKQYLDQKLQEPEFQQLLTTWLITLVDKHTDDIHHFLVKVADRNLPKLVTENTDLAQLARQLSDYVESEISNGNINLEQVVDKFTEIAAENIPDLARWLHEQFEDYNASQGVIKRNFVSFLKWSSDIDESSLKDQLFHLISTHEFRHAVYGFSERMALSLRDYLDTDSGRQQLSHVSEQLNHYLIDKAREEGVPFIIDWIKQWLATPQAWITIERSASVGIDMVTESLDAYIHSARFHSDMEIGLGKLLNYFNVQDLVSQKVMQLDSRRLEDLVMSASRQHLTAIEVFGGILGAFAGIALFSIPTFLAILAVILLLFCVEWLLSKN